MRRSRGPWARLLASLGSLCLVAALAMAGAARGQIQNFVNGQGPLVFDRIVGQPMGLPNLPPQGAWGEVINVTPRWIVIQNHAGQQFPVSVDDINEFLIRWPISLDVLNNAAVIEAVGADQGNNLLQTSHVDVFLGADQTLVRPTYNSLIPTNNAGSSMNAGMFGYINPFQVGGQYMLYGWGYPYAPVYSGLPTRLHVVGNLINRSPLQIAIPGNNIATALPAPGQGFSITQVTRGDIKYVRKGDYTFLLPQQVGQRGLILSQLVLYKSMPLRMFNPNAIR